MDDASHSFIVRLWLEEAGGASEQGHWRGHVTHVPSGARHHLKSLQDLLTFIQPYLRMPGAEGTTPTIR